MKLLVIGRAGQLARSISERCAAQGGIQATLAGRPDLDLEVVGSATQIIASAVPDAIINAAAYAAVDQAEDEPERAYRINADAAGEIAEAAGKAGARLVHLSTDYVFDGSSRNPYAEDAATNPLNAYGHSKLAGEEQVRSAGPEYVIVRTSWVYSPFGRNFARTMIAAAENREVLTVVDDQRGNPSSALDVADGLLAILAAWRAGSRTGVGETFHLAGSGTTSWCGFAQHLMDECRRLGAPSAEVRPIATEDWPTKAERPRNSALDCSKFARDFGFVMPPWQRSASDVVRRIIQDRVQ